jgi:hypothetical protein
MLLTVILIFMLLFVLLLLFVIVSAFLGFLITRVPFVSTYASEIEFITNKLGITSRDVFFDLGSGDGKVCFLVNQLTGAPCVGFELVWWTYLLAQIKLKVKSEKLKIEFRNQNFFKHSWAEADYIYAYLFPSLMLRVEEKFQHDCKPGSTAIIRDFPFPNLKPVTVFDLPKQHRIFIYKI